MYGIHPELSRGVGDLGSLILQLLSPMGDPGVFSLRHFRLVPLAKPAEPLRPRDRRPLACCELSAVASEQDATGGTLVAFALGVVSVVLKAGCLTLGATNRAHAYFDLSGGE